MPDYVPTYDNTAKVWKLEPAGAAVLSPAERLAASGIWYGTQAQLDALDPALKRTPSEWLVDGLGYFEFHVFAPAAGGSVYVVAGATAEIPLVGAAPSVLATRLIQAVSAGIGITAGTPTVLAARLIQAVPAGMGLTAGAPSVVAMRLVQAVFAGMGISAGVPTVSIIDPGTIVVSSPTASLELTAPAPTVAAIYLITPPAADLVLGSNVPVVAIVTVGVQSVAAVGADLVLTAQAPVVRTIYVVAAGPASLQLAANVPAVTTVYRAAATSAEMALMAGAPAINRILMVQAVPATMTLVGNVPTVSVPATVPTQPVISATGGDTTVTIALVSGGTGADTFTIYWGASAGQATAHTNTISGVTLPYTHTERTNGTTYYYTAVGVNEAGPGEESTEKSATAAAAAITLYGTTADGSIGIDPYTSTWSAAHDATSGTVSASGATMSVWSEMLENEFLENVHSIHRSFLYFDLTGVTGPLTQAQLSLTVQQLWYNCTLHAQQGTQAASLASTDFDAFTGTSFGSVAVSSTGEKVITFNASGLSYLNGLVGTGVAKFCVRENHDYTNEGIVAPSPYGVEIYTQEHTTQSQRPKLVLTP